MTSRSETLAEIDAALVEWDSVTVARDPAAAAVADALRKARALIPDPPTDDEREALVQAMDSTGDRIKYSPDWVLLACADAILDAGFRRHAPSPSLSITTREELKALPVGAVVLSEGSAHQNAGDGYWDADGRSYEYHQIQLPASVIYVPEARQA